MKIPEIGVVFRSFSKKEELISETVQRALESARKALGLTIDGRQVFAKTIFLVPVDYDCGGTAKALRIAMQQEGLNAEILEVKGHHSCDALNRALEYLKENEMEYVLFISNKAAAHLCTTVIQDVLLSIDYGDKAIGIDIPEITAVGVIPLNNTFLVWDVRSLCEVGRFESIDGVEEIAPLVRLMKKCGNCAALISGNPEAKLNIRSSKDGQERHKEVKDTKSERQLAELKRMGVTPEWVNAHIKK